MIGSSPNEISISSPISSLTYSNVVWSEQGHNNDPLSNRNAQQTTWTMPTGLMITVMCTSKATKFTQLLIHVQPIFISNGMIKSTVVCKHKNNVHYYFHQRHQLFNNSSSSSRNNNSRHKELPIVRFTSRIQLIHCDSRVWDVWFRMFQPRAFDICLCNSSVSDTGTQFTDAKSQ